MNTKWLGLWAQERPAFYAGQVIKKADIPAYTRIILRYNKFYEKDSNKPKFIYCFADSNGYKSKCVPLEVDDDEEDDEPDIMQKIKELKGVLRDGRCNANQPMLASESQALAAHYQQRAIELVEEITGEEWNFTCLSYW